MCSFPDLFTHSTICLSIHLSSVHQSIHHSSTSPSIHQPIYSSICLWCNRCSGLHKCWGCEPPPTKVAPKHANLVTLCVRNSFLVPTRPCPSSLLVVCRCPSSCPVDSAPPLLRCSSAHWAHSFSPTHCCWACVVSSVIPLYLELAPWFSSGIALPFLAD
jgi:hypothetical protein